MIQRTPSSLRTALESHDPARGKRYPVDLKARAIEHAQARRREGASWVKIAAELGLAFETVRRWCVAIERKQSRALVPVRVVADRERHSVAVVSPGGYRLEGLTLQEAVAALRVIG